MAKVLILMLGKGQAKLQGKEKVEYRNAFYFLPNNQQEYQQPNEEDIIETPFVGYAILQLVKNYSFDKIYILGTNDSMWDVLSLYCSEKRGLDDEGIEQYDKINEEVKKRKVKQVSLKYVANNFTKLTHIHTECQIIKIGKTIDDIKDIFNQLLAIPQKNDTISIDITHGLRFQPFISLLSLFYLQRTKNITIEHIFYGGLELSSEYAYLKENGEPMHLNFRGQPVGLSPIMELNPILDYVEWINAAAAYNNYGDIKPLASLLPNEKKLIDAAEELNFAYQLNLTGEVSKKAKQFTSHLNKIAFNDNNYTPFKVIKDTIAEFPRKLSHRGTDWKTYMMIARRNYDNGLVGLSVLSTWEAIIARFCELYQGSLKKKDFDNYRIVGNIIRNADFATCFANTPFSDFPTKMKRLSQFRNAIAHAEDSASFSLKDVKKEFPALLIFLEKNLGHKSLLNINQKIAYKFH